MTAGESVRTTKLKVDLAITRTVAPSIVDCALTFMERSAIDYDLAVQQQTRYRAVLESCGLAVVVIDADADHPDCCFIEDTAIVFDEVAILTRMGTETRRGEEKGVEPVLRKYRSIVPIAAPATLDGGDVLCMGRDVFVGLSQRTNQAGIDAFRAALEPWGYVVTAIPVTKCLHMKSAVTAVDDETVIINPEWIDQAPFERYRMLRVPAEEPGAAEVMRVNDTVVMHSGTPRTRELIETHGATVKTVDLSEFIKAEAGPTCLSLLLAKTGAAS